MHVTIWHLRSSGDLCVYRSRQLLREAVTLDPRHEGTGSTTYAVSLHNLSGAQIDAGDLYGAEKTLREVLDLRRKLLGNDHPELGYTVNNLAFVLLEKGDAASALPFAEEARTLRTRHLGANDHLTLTSGGNVGRALEALGRYSDADALYEQVLAALNQSGSGDSLQAAQIINYRAQVQFDQRRYAAAGNLVAARRWTFVNVCRRIRQPVASTLYRHS